MTTPEAPQPKRPFILFIEDDPNDAYLLEHALGRVAPEAGILWIADGRDAQDFLAGTVAAPGCPRGILPDLVILDLKLPRLPGLELLEWMKSKGEIAALPVHVLSSSSEPRDVKRAETLGASSYHSKQGSMRALVDVVRTILGTLGHGARLPASSDRPS